MNKTIEETTREMNVRIALEKIQVEAIREFLDKEEKLSTWDAWANRSYVEDRINKFLERKLFRTAPFDIAHETLIETGIKLAKEKNL